MARVLADIKADTVAARASGTASASSQTSTNGVAARRNNSLAVPAAVVEDGVRVTRECLEAVCEVES